MLIIFGSEKPIITILIVSAILKRSETYFLLQLLPIDGVRIQFWQLVLMPDQWGATEAASERAVAHHRSGIRINCQK